MHDPRSGGVRYRHIKWPEDQGKSIWIWIETEDQDCKIDKDRQSGYPTFVLERVGIFCGLSWFLGRNTFVTFKQSISYGC